MSTDPKPSNVRELYVQAARIKDDAARKTFLDEACGTKIELRQRVEQLLAARRADQENLLQLATSDSMSGRSSLSAYGAELGRTCQPHPESKGVDQTQDEAIRGQIDVSTHPIIGNYRLLEELGHGGMGTVYVAAQAKPVKRQVALKVIKPGMDSHEVIARFEAERQALAMMDHPNIARVLDGGTTKEGRPYFVMELVRGIAITEFCRQNSLPLRDRLELFVDICHAVQHAHQKGIIHRDLKPGNIMITLHDGKPVVKVIDFGVAKALHQELTERTLFTHFSHMVGTPLYMSPEQSEMSGLGVDTRSDIYSLGVVLYELLTGTTPFERDAMSRLGIDGIRKLIQEQEPPRPSVRISTLRAANESTIDDQRQLDIAGSAIQLRGEVDWIVMKALEKDRTRRYETADALAEDVRRFLHHKAVLARPQSFLYQASKFIARNKVAVGTTIAIGIVALLGLAGTIWQARKFKGERNRAVELGMELKEQLSETKVANAETRKQAAISKAISDFLQNDLLAKASPENGQYRDVKLRTVLDLAARSINRQFDDQPLVEAALRHTIGVTYHQLGEYDLAKTNLLHALKTRRETLGINAAKSIQSQVEVGRLLTSMGSFDESDSYLAGAVGQAKAALGPEHAVTFQAVYALGSLRFSQDQLDEAIALGETLEKVVIENQQLDDESILNAASLSALVYERQGKYEEAYRILDRNYKTRLNVLRDEHPLTISSLNGRALTSLKLGKKEEAVRDAEAVLRTGRELYGADHPSTANLVNSLATIYSSVDRKDDALRLHREAVEIGDRTLGADHPQMLQYLNNLGARLQDFGKYEEAQRVLLKLEAWR